MPKNRTNDLIIIMKAKDMCSYIMTITQKCPKELRFAFVSRLQNLSLSIMEDLFRANEVYISGFDSGAKQQRRLEYQQSALANLRILDYMAQVSLQEKCITSKQRGMIAQYVKDCQGLLGAWIHSDAKKRARAKEGQRQLVENII